MVLKLQILFFIFSIGTNILSAQDEMDNLFTKVHLNNLLDSTLTTGIYKINGGRYSSYKDFIYNVEYKQDIDTVTIIERFMCFKRKKKGIYIKTKPIVHKQNAKKAFERERPRLEEFLYKLDPKPLILSNNINHIYIVQLQDSSFILHLEIDNYGKKNLEKIYYENHDIWFGVIINDNLLIDFEKHSFIINKALSIDIEFNKCSREFMENIKRELMKKG
jgi:hypothetical protein